MKIERDKVYLTRDGEKARVICTDAPGEFPVVAIHEGGIYRHTAAGSFVEKGYISYSDLVSEYVEPPKPREVWVRVFPNGGVGVARTEDEYAEEVRAEANFLPELVKFREVIE